MELLNVHSDSLMIINTNEGLRERTEYIDIFHPSLSRVLFPMFCLLVEAECQIFVF